MYAYSNADANSVTYAHSITYPESDGHAYAIRSLCRASFRADRVV